MITYYVVQSYQLGKRGMFIPDDPREAQSEGQCRRMVARLAEEGRVGVVGFSRTGDPMTGDWQDAVIIDRRGELPDDEDVFFAMTG